jgi:hypothetical protein
MLTVWNLEDNVVMGSCNPLSPNGASNTGRVGAHLARRHGEAASSAGAQLDAIAIYHTA